MSIIAKSVVFDIADDWTSTAYMGVREINFYLAGVLLSITATDYSAYATTVYSTSFAASFAFDTSLIVTGDHTDRCWLSNSGQVANQRLIVVFNNPQEFDEIRIVNYHKLGTLIERGAKNVAITISTDAIIDTTYNAAISNSTTLNNTIWPEHIASDVADYQTVWTDLVKILSFIDQLYGDLTVSMLRMLEMKYVILFSRLAKVDQIYSLRLGTTIAMYYSDSPTLRKIIAQYYGDSPQLSRAIKMQYGDAKLLRKKLDMEYNIMFPIQQTSNMVYTIAGEHLVSTLDHRYDILFNNILMKQLNMPYMLQAGNSLVQVSVSVNVGGIEVNPTHTNIEYSKDSFVARGEVHLPEASEAIQIHQDDSVIATFNGEDHILIVDTEPRRQRAKIADTLYIVEVVSPAIVLSTPRCKTFTCVFDADTAKNIFEALADPIVVDWQIVDFPVLADTLYANDEDKISVMRKLTASCGAIIQSRPDGSLLVRYKRPVPLNILQSAEPTYYLTDSRNFISQDESFVHNTGYNRYNVSSTATPDERLWLNQDEYPNIQAFEVPWVDTAMTLEHSGGSGVATPVYRGVIEEIYPPMDKPPERVEFIAGYAKSAKPIYGELEVAWLKAQLGSITYSEDGQLDAEVKDGYTDGYSIADIRYKTKYKLWLVDNGTATDVQYILRVNDDDENSSITGC